MSDQVKVKENLEAKVEETGEDQVGEGKGYTVRTMATGDKVFMIKDGERVWVKNPPTLDKLGFVLGQESTIKYEDLLKFKDGGSIDLSGEIAIETKPDEKRNLTVKEKLDEDKINAVLGIKS